ncbi:MAG: phage tail sheath subtilisin-like domain-containing protein [Nitrospira sp.]|nr:phage tail sheath subtilisin-like domain-containing protein [Nitrospira sp.]
MASLYQSPGVYREEVFLKPEAKLPTGVPGFVGFADDRVKKEITINIPFSIHRQAEFVTRPDGRAGGYLADAVSGFFQNGGLRCYVVLADPDLKKDREASLKDAIKALGPLNDLDLVAVPDAMLLQQPNARLDTQAVMRVQSDALIHCATHGNRLALLDALQDGATDVPVLAQRHTLGLGQAEPINGALYYPWLKTSDGRFVPPCGHVAGIVAQTDAKVGVFKAPANEELLGVLDVEVSVDNRMQGELNPEGINVMRAFPGRGIRVWGARTLSRDPNWRYINVRRLILTVRRWIDQNMTWATFETNDRRLWVRIGRELGTYLVGLWRAGGLRGQTVEEAFYIKCDEETNPPDVREAGMVVTEMGLAPRSPAEFVVLRIIHRLGSRELPRDIELT